MTDVSLRYLLFGEDKTASKAFQGAGKSAEAASKHVGAHAIAMGAAVGTFIGGAALNVAAALGQMGASAVTAGVKTASNMEQAQIAFTKLLGSGQKAQTFLGQLATFAAATPFELPGLIDASRQLLGVGAKAKDVIPTLTAYGDAAGALGISQDGFNHIMLATTQAMAAGTLHAGDLLQMTEAGLPVWKLMSEALHKPVSELQKLSAHGKLLSKDVLPKLQAQMEKDYGGSMAKQSQTLSGLWSTLMDTFNQGMAKVIIPLEPLLRQAIPAAADFMGKALAGIASFMTTKVVPAIKWVVDKIGDMKQAFQFGSDWESHSPLETFAQKARIVVDFIRTKIIPAIASFVGWVRTQLWPAIERGAKTILPALKQSFDIIAGAFKGTGAKGVDFKGIIKSVGDFITTKLIPTLAWLATKALPVVATNIRATIDAVKLLIQWFQMVNGAVKTAMTFVLRMFANVSAAIGAFLIALSHIPGFGWAKDAGKKMLDAASAARKLADALNAIPPNKTVTVNTYFKTHTDKGLSAVGSGAGVKGYASGGTNIPAGWAMVGEQGPEYMYIPGGSTILPHGRTPSGGGVTNVYLSGTFFGNTDTAAQQIQQALLRLKNGSGGMNLGLA